MSADPSTPRGSASIRLRRRPGHVGLVSLGQLLLVEALVVTALALVNRGWLVVSVAVLVGGVVVVAVFVRREGRWWTELSLMRWHYQRRRAQSPGACDDRRLAALRVLTPELDVQNVDRSDGTRVGVGQDHAGWFVIMAVSPPSGLQADALTALPVGRLTRTLAESRQPGTVLQVVIHTVPAPSAAVDVRHRCTTSYRQLLESYGPVPASQTVWVAVRLDARTLAAAVNEPDRLGQAPAALAALARRVGRVLGQSGLTHQILDADGVLDALARSCDLEQPAPGTTVPVTREHWRSWASDHLAQVCFWVRQWPAMGGVGALVSRLTSTPAALTSVALVLQPADDGTDVRCLVRVAASPSAIDAACRGVTEAAERAGARLLRLDGEHATAVYATAPTGGGVG